MQKILYAAFFLLVLQLVLPWQHARAQTRTPFTSDNTISVALEGQGMAYTYTSNSLLVRYNTATQNLECILNVSTLYPANDSIPPTMAYDVLFGAKYPELILEISAPAQQVNAANPLSGTTERTATIRLQGVANQTVIPLAFTSERGGAVFFSTGFDLMLDHFGASVPVKYVPLLTGRVVITINKARWAELQLK